MPDTNLDRFIAATQGMGWSTIKALHERAVLAGLFDGDPQRWGIKGQKAMVRRWMQSRKNASGGPLFVSLQSCDEDGRPIRHYKQVAFMNEDDCRQVIAYWNARANKCLLMANYFHDYAKESFGVEIPTLYDQ